MDFTDFKDAMFKITPYALVILVPIGLVIGAAYLEAKAYTRLTGKQVTIVDALLLDLRITEDVK